MSRHSGQAQWSKSAEWLYWISQLREDEEMSCFSNSEESELYLVGSRDTSKLYKQSRVTHSDSFPRMFTKTLNKVRAMTIPETLESSCSDPGWK